MTCDFQTVTDTLLKNMASSTTIFCVNLLNTLFGAYLKDAQIYEFVRYTSAKLHNGINRVAPEMSEFYLNADRELLCRDIRELIPSIFDKPNTYKELYQLIRFDDTLSAALRKDVLSRVPADYSDDASLVNMIYEAVYLAVTRQYKKQGAGYAVLNYTSNALAVRDALFANSEYVPPCRNFCGRDAELAELHALVQDNSTVIITGLAGIGKSELVRAYAERHRSEYTYFGYYFYKGSLKTIIADCLGDPMADDENARYRNNLELCATCGTNVLLIIDNFNATPEEDDCFYDLADLKCKVIFTSHKHYEDLCVYELKEFRSAELLLQLVGKYYKYSDDVRNTLLKIIEAVDRHTFCVELCARVLNKGYCDPAELLQKLSEGMQSIEEPFAATKDKHSRKKTYYDHIRDLFDLMGLPADLQSILRMLVVSPVSGIRKRFMADLIGMRNLIPLDDLVELGLVYEFPGGAVTLQPIIRNLVGTELKPDDENCAPVVKSLQYNSLDETMDREIVHNQLLDVVDMAVRYITFRDQNEHFVFVSDCFSIAARLESAPHMRSLLDLEKKLVCSDHANQNALYNSNQAEYELLLQNFGKAFVLQETALKYAMTSGDTMLRANMLSSYGYCLRLMKRHSEALQVLEQSIALFHQLETEKIATYNKYRTIFNYANLLFQQGRTSEAIRQVLLAENELSERQFTSSAMYAECLYTLGLFHLKLHDPSAEREVFGAFRILIGIYGKDSDLVQSKYQRFQQYLGEVNSNINQYASLTKLLEG